MNGPDGTSGLRGAAPRRGQRFRYEGYEIDPDAGRLTCRYSLDGRDFTETVTFPGGGDWASPAADAAARLVFLLAGVSYYKTGAPPVIDLGDHLLTADERAFLRAYYYDGLGEFAYENRLDLSDIQIVAGDGDGADGGDGGGADGVLVSKVVGEQPLSTQVRRGGADLRRPQPPGVRLDRPLVPFGGGLDSVVTVELVRPVAADAALFVVNPPGDRFDAIERAIKVTGLPVVRAERAIDLQVRRPISETGFLNGHVPVTGIISAIAVLAAVLERRGAVVMSNEWSASKGTLEVDGRWINHQWSKSLDFERAFRGVVAASVAPDLEYFSRLRPYTELWIARRFAELRGYHLEFHSCNRAFASDPAKRLDHWCGECAKCCFIDLILAPFLPEERLRQVFGGREPLANPSLGDEFERLLATSAEAKPFECVGDVDECRVAVTLAARRPDRAAFPLLHELAAKVAEAAPPPVQPLPAGPLATSEPGGRGTGTGPDVEAEAEVNDVGALLRPIGPHFIPDLYATDDLVV